MKETRFFMDGNKVFQIEFDQEELIEIRDKIIEEMSIVDYFKTESPDSPYYSPNNVKERKDIQIRDYKEWYKPWIDVWELYCSSYARYVIPYIARLISDLLEGKCESVKDIKKLNCGKEYIPIRETIEEYTELITKFKEYHTEFPNSPLCCEAEARVAEENIKKYIDIMLDDNYANKFRNYYETISQMISVSEVNKEIIAQKSIGQKKGPFGNWN